jgi:hypothetical protein
MKIHFASSVVSCVLLSASTAFAAQPSPAHADNAAIPKAHLSTPVSTNAAAPIVKKGGEAGKPAVAALPTPAPAPIPAKPAPTPASGITLDAYMKALTAAVSLSKDQQTNIKSYYLGDGAKMQAILNDASLSPLQQTQQIDALRDRRNDTIEELLSDAAAQQKFLQVEAKYRVALVILAANGGMASSTTPSMPKPAAAPST